MCRNHHLVVVLFGEPNNLPTYVIPSPTRAKKRQQLPKKRVFSSMIMAHRLTHGTAYLALAMTDPELEAQFRAMMGAAAQLRSAELDSSPHIVPKVL